MCLPTQRGVLRAGLVVALFAAVLVAGPSAAHADEARKIYLNGVDLTDVDVRNQSFKGAEIRFDSQGNLHIRVKGFRIAKTGAPAARAKAGGATASPTAHGVRAKAGRISVPALITQAANGRYFVIARTPASGAANPYEVTVRLNGKLIRKIGPTSATMAIDVTRFVRPGANELSLHAVRKHAADPKRRSFSPVDRMEIVLGQGEISKGTVLIKHTHLEYKRNAGETRTSTQKFKFYMR